MLIELSIINTTLVNNTKYYGVRIGDGLDTVNIQCRTEEDAEKLLTYLRYGFLVHTNKSVVICDEVDKIQEWEDH